MLYATRDGYIVLIPILLSYAYIQVEQRDYEGSSSVYENLKKIRVCEFSILK
jgi:hypothetical protein